MDPLTQTLHLLRPKALTWKEAECAADWALRFPAIPGVAFSLVAAGQCRLRISDAAALLLHEGDFVLLTSPPVWTLSDGAPTKAIDGAIGHLGIDRLRTRIGDGPVTTRLVGGHFAFEGADIGLLTSLLPPMVRIAGSDPGAARLRGVLDLIADEAFCDRPGRALVLERLLDIMLVETIRQGVGAADQPRQGLLAGLADPQVAAALRALHADAQHSWTVGELAAAAGASRSAFAARFNRIVGMPPIDYLLTWRMALARDALRSGSARLSDIAFACGYQSASAFSTAFRRSVGCSPARYAADQRAA